MIRPASCWSSKAVRPFRPSDIASIPDARSKNSSARRASPSGAAVRNWQNAASPYLARRPIDHQNSTAGGQEADVLRRVGRRATPGPLRRPPARCQSHSTKRLDHRGDRRRRHDRPALPLSLPDAPIAPAPRRALAGRLHSRMPSGRDAASRGAATIMMISCSTMCAVNERSPRTVGAV